MIITGSFLITFVIFYFGLSWLGIDLYEVLGIQLPEIISQILPNIVGILGLILFWLGNRSKLKVSSEFKKWEPLARQKNAVGQYKLGKLLEAGLDVPQDRELALGLYKLSAEQGYPPAQWVMGYCHYDELNDVEKNDKEAMRGFKLAAEQDHVHSQFDIGTMYELGEGVTKDNIYAYMWYEIVALSGKVNCSYTELALDRKKNIELIMSNSDISSAQKLAREWVENKTKLV